MTDLFSNLEDDAQVNSPQVPESAPIGAGGLAGLHVENCAKCHGTGVFTSWAGNPVGRCHACKGTGKRTFKTDRATRAKRRVQSEAAKTRAFATNVATFIEEFPAEHEYLVDHQTNEFCSSLLNSVLSYGHLTEKQLAAVRKAIQRDADDATRKAEPGAPVADTTALLAAFDAATGNGLKRPTIRLPGVTLSLAPATGKNPGAIYAKADGTYVGKIVDGSFHRSHACTDTAISTVQAALVDPLSQAKVYGQRTGSCSCCGRELTNKDSITAGIGPICASKFGW